MVRYVSPELSHFVGRGLPSDSERFDLLIKILQSGILTSTPGRMGGASTFNTGGRLRDESMYHVESVCFCDIPLGDLDLHMSKYSQFGLSFDKGWLASRGANPVYYLDTDSYQRTILGDNPRAEQFEKAFLELSRIGQALERHATHDPSLRLLSSDFTSLELFLQRYLLSFIKPFDGKAAASDPKNYYMEREWRFYASLQFDPADVARILIPRKFATRLRAEAPDYTCQVTFTDPM